MSYLDRLRDLRYTAPSGAEFTAHFVQVSRAGGKKAPVTEFPGQNQGAVQDLGATTPILPISCYIDGDDYDITADQFWVALFEKGTGFLHHPRWGDIRVLPVPKSQKENFVEGVGRADFEIDFIKVDDEIFDYPDALLNHQAEVGANVDAAVDVIAESVPTNLSTAETDGLKGMAQDTVDAVAGAFGALADITAEVRSEIEQVIADVTNNIDTLVDGPANLMREMLRLYRLPARVVGNIQAKISAYKTIFENLVDGYKQTTADFGENIGKMAVGSISGLQIALAEASQYGTFATRNQSGEAMAELVELNASITNGLQDLGGTDYALQKAIDLSRATSLAGLVIDALNLPAEKKHTLTANQTPLQVVWDLYGYVERLDEFIEFNDLAGDEILWLPAGTKVLYYD